MTTRHATTEHVAGYRTQVALAITCIAATMFALGYMSGQRSVPTDARVVWVDTATFGSDFNPCVDAPEAAIETGINCGQGAGR